MSSDDSDMPPGVKWLERIDNKLNSSNLFLVICSKSSIERPWINFEAGAGWIKEVPLIPLCHTGVSKGTLPPPYNRFQALDMEIPDFPKKLMEAISTHNEHLKIPRLDYDSFSKELLSVIESSTASNEKERRPKQKIVEDEFSLDDEHSKMLEFVESLGSEATVGGAAHSIGISTTKSQYILDRLVDRDLIRSSYDLVSGASYYCTSKGTKYLIENNIVE